MAGMFEMLMEFESMLENIINCYLVNYSSGKNGPFLPLFLFPDPDFSQCNAHLIFSVTY